MKKFYGILAVTIGLLTGSFADPFQEAQVTKAINNVSLVAQERKVKAASEGDTVKGDTGIKTGDDSRAELRFPDATVLRVGANSLFSFQSGGRKMDLENGTMLFSSPKGEGGGQVQAGAVTAAVTGTNFLLARNSAGQVRLIVLEGKVWLYFTADPKNRRAFRAGQTVTVPPGAIEIPRGMTIDLRRLLVTSRLIEAGGFAPLERLALIQRVADSQQGRIHQIPDSLNRDQQTAQTTRRQQSNVPRPPAMPSVTPPRPMPTPFVAPTPIPAPPTPAPSGSPGGSPGP